MATSFIKVYEAFLGRIAADDWTVEEDFSIVERDWQQLLDMAIFRFKYPRVDLTKVSYDADSPSAYAFAGDLTNDEIQMLALYMKHEWIKRCIANWQNIQQLYADSDFSPANHLNQLIKLESSVALEIKLAEGVYDRSNYKQPSPIFYKLAGKQ